jgi:hypothetical protein
MIIKIIFFRKSAFNYPLPKISKLSIRCNISVESRASNPKLFTEFSHRGITVFHGGYVPPVEPVVPTPKPHSTKDIVKIGGLMYQNQPFSSQDKSNYDNDENGGRVWDWKGAKGYCQGLTLGGYSDWRLPNKSELNKLLTKSKNSNSRGYKYYIKKDFVENMPPLNGKYASATFWSSTEKDSSYAWGVNFLLGSDRWFNEAIQDYALCVR